MSGNLIANPSFESDLAYWQADHVSISSAFPCEGRRAASLGPDPCSLYQDVRLGPAPLGPLFLSFMVCAGIGAGDLQAEVLWLNDARAFIGTGLRILVPGGSINHFWKTIFDVTGPAPPDAAFARLSLRTGLGHAPLFRTL